MNIRVRVRSFPGTDEERTDLVAAVRRYCACTSVDVGPASVMAIDDVCALHDLLGDDAALKQLVFQRRWYRSRGIV